MDPRELPDRIENLTALDAIARPIASAVDGALAAQPRLRGALSGDWLGHAAHPLFTDLPIGFWTSAWVLDIVGGRASRTAARRLVGWGVLSAIPTALTGASDWSPAAADDDGARRVGAVHAAANTTALACYVASWLSRRRGRHGRGVAWGMAGAAAATVGGHLGGHLAYRLGVRVEE